MENGRPFNISFFITVYSKNQVGKKLKDTMRIKAVLCSLYGTHSVMNPVGFFFQFSEPLCAVFWYVWELYWSLVFCRFCSSLSTVCRSKSGSVPGFSVGLQGHLAKTENRGPIVLDTITQAFPTGWTFRLWYDTSGANFCRGNWESWRELIVFWGWE